MNRISILLAFSFTLLFVDTASASVLCVNSAGQIQTRGKCKKGETLLNLNALKSTLSPGPQGIAGQAGTQGERGEAGAKGEKGDKGDPGAQGITGATGPQGPIGPMGSTGPKGDSGPSGVSGGTVTGRLVIGAIGVACNIPDSNNPIKNDYILLSVPGTSTVGAADHDGQFSLSYVKAGNHQLVWANTSLLDISVEDGQTTNLGDVPLPGITYDCCGNGDVDQGEVCDNGINAALPNFGGITCSDFEGPFGTLRCIDNCHTIEHHCFPTACGDGVLQPGEECDPQTLLPGGVYQEVPIFAGLPPGQFPTCSSLGFSGNDLVRCSSTCHLNTLMCQ